MIKRFIKVGMHLIDEKQIVYITNTSEVFVIYFQGGHSLKFKKKEHDITRLEQYFNDLSDDFSTESESRQQFAEGVEKMKETFKGV